MQGRMKAEEMDKREMKTKGVDTRGNNGGKGG